MSQDETKKEQGGIKNYFYGPIGQYIEHVEHNHFGMSGDGSFQFGDANNETIQKKLFPDLPTREEMCRAVTETVKQGMWWSNRSWAVVYRVYQMKGYMKGFRDFVREVETWPVSISFVCNYDAVQKPIAEGLLVGNIDKWEANGAHKQNVRLATVLLEEIEKNTQK